MKTLENTNGSQVNDWHAFRDSLIWNNCQIQHENIQETFLEAMKCGVQRHMAFDEVANYIRRSGTTVKNNTLHKLWHSARCKYSAWQRGNGIYQPTQIRNRPTVNGHDECKTVNEQEIDKIPRNEGDANILVIDGLNVIYGTPSHQNPNLMNLLGLLFALQKHKLTFKCFFDASTPFKLSEAGRTDEAEAYRQFCFGYPDTFIEVPARNQADRFLLQYANHTRSQIISNDCFRDYNEKYPWLKWDYNRRVSFIVHSNTLQIPALDLMATIPEDLASADLSLRAGLRNPLPANPHLKTNGANNHAHTNGKMAEAA